ncbi:LOG family protein YvdD [Planctomycetes bacterium Poly30]|uniref:Cytokinin riboside 5'-monophosphate phosphoribohydrolase n=1 Tax=Saltatorellus ferox TaxID=2528018 RepID=A0A518EN56_9BACT|nr:LOG family protein YvdD [Planctomycetes bacterium Poly30]
MTRPSSSSDAPQRICVFCGSNDGAHPRYLEMARATGRAIVSRGKGVVYGGGNRGLMGAVADAALEAGGEVHGVLPFGLQTMEVAHRELTHLDVVDTLHERKARMMELSSAFLVLPGGHGTLEEFFEVLTWLQLAIHDCPVGVLNLNGYYEHVVQHLDLAVREGFIRPEHRALVLVESDLETLLDRMDAWTPPPRPRWAGTRPRP